MTTTRVVEIEEALAWTVRLVQQGHTFYVVRQRDGRYAITIYPELCGPKEPPTHS